MTGKKEHKLQIIITYGPENLAHAVLGFAFAASAAISDISVKVILTLNGVNWSKDEVPAAHKKVSGFDSVREYMNILGEHNADIYLCSTCAKHCDLVNKQGRNNSFKFPYIGFTELATCASSDSTRTIVF